MHASLRRLIMLALIATPHVTSAAQVTDFVDLTLFGPVSPLLPGRLYEPPEATGDPTTPRLLVLPSAIGLIAAMGVTSALNSALKAFFK